MLTREVKNLRANFLVASRKNKKIYPTSSAFCFVFNHDFYNQNNLEKIAELAVAEKIKAEYYYRNSFEVDFLQKSDDQIIPIEVKYGDTAVDVFITRLIKTDYLIVGENSGSKYDKAIKLKVKIITEKELLDLLSK